MSRQPGGISRLERMDALRAVLKRWGRLGKTQVDAQVAARLGCGPEEVSRALYRDLEELVAKNELRVLHFTRDGAEIQDFDPETHRNTRSEWVTTDGGAEVSGGGILKMLGIRGAWSARIRSALSVEESWPSDPDTEERRDRIQVLFFFDHHSVRLELDPGTFPMSFLIGRSPVSDAKSVTLEQVEERFGKRSVHLQFPTRTLSSSKSPEQIGHFCLELCSDREARVHDLHSKNGTRMKSLSRVDLRRMLMEEKVKQGATVTLESFQHGGEGAEVPLLAPGEVRCAAFPLLIEAATQFRVLVF